MQLVHLPRNKLRNSISDKLLNDCLVTFIEQDVFTKDLNCTIRKYCCLLNCGLLVLIKFISAY